MKKRILSIFICMILLVGMLPVSALAAYEIDSGKCGENAKWTLDSNYTLTISGKGDMYDYDLTLTEWSVEKVVIKDGITSIGSHAFVGRRDLTSVTIPDSVTKIGDYAFYACESLPKIDIPDSVTYIGECAFLYCYSLAEYTIPENITYIGESAFYGVPASKNYNTYSDAESIIDIGVCGDDLVWTLDDTYAMTITGEGDMYDFDLTLTEWSVESVVIEEGVTSIGSKAFVGRSGLSSITIPDTVTKIGDFAFYYCQSLSEIVIPASVNYIGSDVFMDCSNLEVIRFEGDAPEFADGEIFSYYNLTIYYPKGNTTWDEEIENWSGSITWIENDPSAISDIEIEETNDNIEEDIDLEDVALEDISESDSEKGSDSVYESVFKGIFKGVIAAFLIVFGSLILFVIFVKIKDKIEDRANNK